MKTLIICNTPEETNRVYELLVDPNKGLGQLKGKKRCTDDHTAIPTIMEFDLTESEINQVKLLPEVKSAKKIFEHSKPILHANSIHQECKPRQSYYTLDPIQADPLIAPHSLYCSLNSEVISNNEFPLSYNSDSINLSFNDCSNVDIIVVDSGVDATHLDFSNSEGTSRVVDFDWGVLTELSPDGDTTQPIIPNWSVIRPSFLTDDVGHGTGCASLAAGNRCGIAKNASLYSLKIFGGSSISTLQALKCVNAFLLAKSNNEFNLNSSRPTIITNSWGYQRMALGSIDIIDNSFDESYMNLLKFTGADLGYQFSRNGLAGLIGSPELPDIDYYVREIIANGGHFLRAAGNDNAYTSNATENVMAFHIVFNGDYVLIPSNSVTDSYFESFKYGDAVYDFNFTYYGIEDVGFYASPGIGIGEANDGLITVGDVSLIGELENCWSTAAAQEPFLEGSDNRTIINNTVRYRTYEGNKFVKSYYSNFGPDVDIYATGNDTIAAKSNQQLDGPTFMEISSNEKYRHFNGTSAATPIVAGILASYLADNPTSTPQQAKEWLLSNGSKGNILKTAVESVPKIINGKDAPFSVLLPVIDRSKSIEHFRYWPGNNSSRENFLISARFGEESNNIVAQAFPLRNAILETEEATVNVFGTTLDVVQTGLITPKTHTL